MQWNDDSNDIKDAYELLCICVYVWLYVTPSLYGRVWSVSRAHHCSWVRTTLSLGRARYVWPWALVGPGMWNTEPSWSGMLCKWYVYKYEYAMNTKMDTKCKWVRIWIRIRIRMYVHKHALEMESPYEKQVSVYDDDTTISHPMLFPMLSIMLS